jgi:hypothetical protein
MTDHLGKIPKSQKNQNRSKSMKLKNINTVCHNRAEAPAWLISALRSYHGSGGKVSAVDGQLDDAFRERCRMAALLALDIAKMRAGRKDEDHRPEPLFDYVRTLAEKTGADFQRLLVGFGIIHPDRLAEPTIEAFARLSARLGLELNEAIFRLRQQFTRFLGLETVEHTCGLGRGGGNQDPWKHCEAALNEAEACYSREHQVSLDRAVRAMKRAYNAEQM